MEKPRGYEDIHIRRRAHYKSVPDMFCEARGEPALPDTTGSNERDELQPFAGAKLVEENSALWRKRKPVLLRSNVHDLYRHLYSSLSFMYLSI